MVTEYPFTNLVFEGGGVKGIAYVGALQVLADRGILGQVTAVAGTSAGAITACLVAAGYTPDELGTIMRALDLTTFEDGKFEGPIRVVEKYGWYRGDAFLSWLRTQISGKLGSPDATFADLQRQTAIDLRVVATDLSTGLPTIHSVATSPDQQLAEAVRMSMSIPLFFAAVQSAGSVFVDGGAVWNYPIEIFDDASHEPGDVGTAPRPAGKEAAAAEAHPRAHRVREAPLRRHHPRPERLLRAKPGRRRPLGVHR